ncbi:MAG: 4-(cytidine 5'-diphospho)-2-C-methyl-D-erythritol kinase [Christensenellales bacterium]
MKLRVYGKINLSLHVGEKRGNLHGVDGIMSSIGLYDEVSIDFSDAVCVSMDGRAADGDNTVFKALKVFSEDFFPVNVSVDIRKGIPFSSGLGGSSADAAAVLFALGKMCGKDVSRSAIRVGSDVPFMLRGGTARVSGNGETVQPFEAKSVNLLILTSGQVNTGEAFGMFDKIGKSTAFSEETVKAARSADCKLLKEYARNDLYSAACALNPDIGPMRSELEGLGAEFVSLSGSGSAVFGIFGEPFEYVGKYTGYWTKTRNCGIEVTEK